MAATAVSRTGGSQSHTNLMPYLCVHFIIALFGISTMEGVILLAYYNQLLDEGWKRQEAVWHAAVVRMRPVMMTCVAACVGLLPAGGGLKGAAAGVGNVAKTGAQAAGQKVADGARSMKERMAAAFRPDDAGSASGGGAAQAASEAPATAPSTEQPAWAKRLHRRQQLTHAATTAAHTLRGGDGGSSSQGPSLRDSDS